MKKPHVFKYEGDWYAEYRDFTSHSRRGFPYLKVYSVMGSSPGDAYRELMKVISRDDLARVLKSSPR